MNKGKEMLIAIILCVVFLLAIKFSYDVRDDVHDLEDSLSRINANASLSEDEKEYLKTLKIEEHNEKCKR